MFEGEPILAVAAVDEAVAAEAIERIQVDLERLPFVIDPIDSLRPGGPDARTTGNVFTVGGGIKRAAHPIAWPRIMSAMHHDADEVLDRRIVPATPRQHAADR